MSFTKPWASQPFHPESTHSKQRINNNTRTNQFLVLKGAKQIVSGKDQPKGFQWVFHGN